MHCLVCDSDSFTNAFQKLQDYEYNTCKPVDFYKCLDCSLLIQTPPPNSEIIQTFYPPNYRNYLPIGNGIFTFLKKLQSAGLAKRISQYFGGSKEVKILEIGPGNGQLLLILKETGYEKLYAADFTDTASSILQNCNIQFHASNIEDNFPYEEKFDVIIMNNVIEHLLNPARVLINCCKHLNKKGKVILITPNSNDFGLSIFKKYWAGFHSPRHIYIFNQNNMTQLARKLGFTKIINKPIIDIAQWSISVQNILQGSAYTKTKLENGMAWYTILLTLMFSVTIPVQMIPGKSASMMTILQAE
ncbi:MAG: class I SAM-dependent methyltransferase [Planctomycetes bacterium]|nr:class I SAM-dependent methyltransferase [Planctomycetota bacterium]